MLPLLLVFAIAFLLFGLIPGLGAFAVRRRWRTFRRRMLEVSRLPFIGYFQQPGEDRLLGDYRIFGDLESLQGENRIYINSGRFTVGADLKDVVIYLLPSSSGGGRKDLFEQLEETLPDEELRTVLWKKIFSLPAGTRVFVGGALFSEGGRGIFRSLPQKPLVVVIYDGNRETILLRSIWGGRQKNEYWNRYTLPALIAGSIALLLTSYVMLGTPYLRFPSLVALCLSVFPVAALLPPGVLFYFLYAWFWKRARLLRAQRDLFRLPLRYFETSETWKQVPYDEQIVTLPSREPYLLTNRPGGVVGENLTIRGSGMVFLPEARRGSYYLFGALKQGAQRVIVRPEDPMAELVLILGDPVLLSAACSRRARWLELLAALFIFSGLAVNLLLVLVLLHYLIR
jgi:hypothetical protein